MDILNKYVARGRRTASRIWGDTAIVMLLPRGNVNTKENLFELSKMGTHIWKLLEKKTKVRDVIDSIAKEKGIDSNSIQKEVITFIRKLVKDKIVDFLDRRED